MVKKRLGISDLEITPMGVGAWAMGGGGWQFSWGPQDDAESIAAIHAALDAGVNWIDTAAIYGLGHSEEVVARALEGRANRPYVFTKCQRVWNERREISGSLKADSVRRECEASLRRLKVDTIDLYQIHWPDPDADVEEGWTTLAKLREEGKVRWIGVSNFNAAQIERCRRIAPVVSLQPPYSAISPEVERETLPYCQRNNIGVIVYSPMKSGLLTGTMTRERVANFAPDDFRRNALAFQDPHLVQKRPRGVAQARGEWDKPGGSCAPRSSPSRALRATASARFPAPRTCAAETPRPALFCTSLRMVSMVGISTSMRSGTLCA
jgi:aryl-alcohol dehydrogenase-like predicted oxidoreductase